MTAKKLGEQAAFPAEHQYEGSVDGVRQWLLNPGLTKRELFAALAMAGNLANPKADGPTDEHAMWALRHVDALLAELAKHKGVSDGN